MDETIRKPDKVADTSATLRVEAVPSASNPNGDVTIRPGGMQPGSKSNAGDFVLKGRLYRGIKCLSDNSGEAQVYLVEGDEGQMVLKIYYPNFTIKKTRLWQDLC